MADDDIQDLMNQLNEPIETTYKEVIDKLVESAVPDEACEQPEPVDDTVQKYEDEIIDDDDDDEVKVHRTIGVEEKTHDIQVVSSNSKKPVPAQPTVTLDVNKIIEQHEADYKETVTNIRKDRVKIDEVISNLMAKIDVNAAVPPRMGEVESLVRACDSLSNTNVVMVKLMDARSKLISALKGQIGSSKLSMPNNSDDDKDLNEMLQQPEDDA